eukprot:ANDGO_05070.mRNA.1 hypothetical protein
MLLGCLVLIRIVVERLRYTSTEYAIAKRIAELEMHLATSSLNREFAKTSRLEREIGSLRDELVSIRRVRPFWRRHLNLIPRFSRYVLLISSFAYFRKEYVHMEGTVADHPFDFFLPSWLLLLFLFISLESLLDKNPLLKRKLG